MVEINGVHTVLKTKNMPWSTRFGSNFDAVQVVTELVHAADRSLSKLPDRKSEIAVLVQTLNAKTDAEEKEEKKILDRDMDDIGEGSARGTVSIYRVAVDRRT